MSRPLACADPTLVFGSHRPVRKSIDEILERFRSATAMLFRVGSAEMLQDGRILPLIRPRGLYKMRYPTGYFAADVMASPAVLS